MVGSSSRRSNDPIRRLCKLAGVPDIETYLGLRPGGSAKEALVRLERKRRELEASLRDPRRAEEAELFFDAYTTIRAAVAPPPSAPSSGRRGTPDYYAILGVQPGASYARIERAWRQAQSEGRDREPVVSQAWRVLGDPLNRAHYDRSRRVASPSLDADPTYSVDPTDPVGTPPPVAAEPATAHATIPGPSLREVVLDEGSTVVALPIVVHGRGRWHADITTDHPCVSTRPVDELVLAPGRHSVAVRFDPTAIRRAPLTCTVTLSNAHEQHVLAFRVVQHAPRRLPGGEKLAYAAAAVVLVIAGWWLGQRATVGAPADGPTTLGQIAQVPTIAACFGSPGAPLPSHVDVHTDGLGRPTGFRFGGAGSPEAEACVRTALLGLDFPPTRDGLPAFHRYRLPPTPSSTPGSP